MFNTLKVLTIHSLILKNVLIYQSKAHHIPELLPTTIRTILTENSITVRPQLLVAHTNSICIKGKRLFNEINSECTEAESPLPTGTISIMKNHINKYLLAQQSLGPENEWIVDNCGQFQTMYTASYSPQRQITESAVAVTNYYQHTQNEIAAQFPLPINCILSP